MKEVEYFNWRIYDPIRKKTHTTRWKMPREEALKLDPNAVPQLGSREVRKLPETDEERAQMTGRGPYPGNPRVWYDDKGNPI